MKPFRFSLQPLRVLREQKEQTTQQRYAQALRVCEQAAALVQSTSEELHDYWSTVGREIAAGVDGAQLLRARAWCNALEIRLKDRTATLEGARQQAETVWKELMQATRDREALDRFHHKRRHAHDRELQREEQKNLDELAVHMATATSALRPRAGI